MRGLGTGLMVLWLAREGTYIREAKNARVAMGWLLDAINKMLSWCEQNRTVCVVSKTALFVGGG
ncbi:MAG: hypothetical protein FJW34_25670 [Acidobacteria bacterium]|nr:hypothetical protein [Acidobacteriota bacterium]